MMIFPMTVTIDLMVLVLKLSVIDPFMKSTPRKM